MTRNLAKWFFGRLSGLLSKEKGPTVFLCKALFSLVELDRIELTAS